MNPGRELDALIAEKVLGWSWDEKTAISPSGSRNAVKAGDPFWWLPEYSIDIAAAWEVVEKMKQLDFNFTLQNDSFISGWEAAFSKANSHTVWFREESAPHAICLAALQALRGSNGP